MTETQEEPGFGRYRDKEFGQVGFMNSTGFWEHGERGWRYFEDESDTEPGNFMTWESAELYAPFTPVDVAVPGVIGQHEHSGKLTLLEEPRALPIENAMERRAICLRLAVETHASPNFRGGDILEIAKRFENYVMNGGE